MDDFGPPRDISVTERQLLACFGVEPRWLDPDVASWYYNTATYTVALDPWEIVFMIQPSCRDVRLTIRAAGQPWFDLSATAVKDIRVIDQPGVDAIEMILDERTQLRFQLRLSVHIELTHH
ncbi:MAG: hypothetical protein RMJ56_12430 [Gemmataceae bacterium]|nr:hypothetical protein [Gemmata sp.]MDW8198400.1 hypothetical protein [Gemmataceae bacterium]